MWDSKVCRIIIICTLSVLGAVILAYEYGVAASYNRFYPGTIINGINMSCRTIEDAENALAKEFKNTYQYNSYEYSLKEVDTKYFKLEKYKDPDVRYYACVVDKNRAGAKPRVAFRLDLDYNHWEEYGYLRLKQKPIV